MGFFMFYALPAETVFEAKQRTRRATVYLFLMLAVLYVGFFNLLLISFFLLFDLREFEHIFPKVPLVAYIATGLAIAMAWLHFLVVRGKTLVDMLEDLPKRLQAQFINRQLPIVNQYCHSALLCHICHICHICLSTLD